MENFELLPSTAGSIQHSLRSNHSQKPSAKHTKSSSIANNPIRNLYKKRNNSQITDSNTTLLNNPNISDKLNDYKLKLSLKAIYDTDPKAKLKEIFKSRAKVSPTIADKEKHRKVLTARHTRKKTEVDSMFEEKEAELIREELNTIKNKKVWNKVIKNFKQSPNTLLDLIPLEKPQKSRIQSAVKRKSGSNFYKQKSKVNPQDFTRPQSISPIEAATFLEEQYSSSMTEDWHKSLLYSNIKSDIQSKYPFTLQELTILSHKIPRDHNSILDLIEKGIDMLRLLMLEMLGTKEDVHRFENRYLVSSPRHAKALISKCIGLYNIRKVTDEILRLIIERENIMKSLEKSNNCIKEKVVRVYELNKIIREKIARWAEEEYVPFDKFTFKGKDYLVKISEDLVLLQNYLASPYVLYTWY